MHIHLIAILLFPVRLVTAPLAVPALALLASGISGIDTGAAHHGLWYFVPGVTVAWLFW